MPENAWYVLIAAGALVVLLALWKGRGLVIARDRVEVLGDPPPAAGQIRVGHGMKIDGSTVGDIAGVKSKGDVPTPGASIDVLTGGEVTGSTVGDIAGVKHEGGK